MRMIVAGSRTIRDYDLVAECVEQCYGPDDISEIVHGGADGVDTLADEWATWHGIRKAVFDPSDPHSRTQYSWKKDGLKAGPKRNREMACYGDALVAVWDGVSSGTKSMVSEAVQVGMPVDRFTVIDGGDVEHIRISPGEDQTGLTDF